MSLETWNQLHKGQNMKTVKFLTNVGTIDQKKLGLPDDCLEDSVHSLEDELADKVIRLGWAKQHDAQSQRDDEKRKAESHEAAIAAAMPAARRKIAEDEAVAEAVRRIKSGDVTPKATAVVSDEDEVIAQIGRMTSKEKLQHVVDSDKRQAVQEAAKKRLATL